METLLWPLHYQLVSAICETTGAFEGNWGELLVICKVLVLDLQ